MSDDFKSIYKGEEMNLCQVWKKERIDKNRSSITKYLYKLNIQWIENNGQLRASYLGLTYFI